MQSISPPLDMSENLPPHRLKKTLLEGAVTNNVQVIHRQFPNTKLAAPGKRDLRRPLLALIVGVLFAPFVAVAVSPRLTEQYATWIYWLPGTSAIKGTLAFGATSPGDTGTVSSRGDLEQHGLQANPPGQARTDRGALVASTADRIEDLSLRFEEPTRLDRKIFDLGVHRVIVDPGHGGAHSGTSVGNLAEKEITLDIGLRVRDLLEESGLEVFMTRVDDTTVELDDRIAFANDSRGDVFLSIHVNWLGARTVRGIETFYLGTTTDPEISRRASVENRNSGYSLTDFRSLLDGIYVDLRRDESRELATQVHRAMLGAIKQQNPKVRDRGVKQAPFVVLVGTDMPAILAEVSAINNREEAALLRTDAYRATIANALADGVVAYAELLQPGSLSEPAATTLPAQLNRL